MTAALSGVDVQHGLRPRLSACAVMAVGLLLFGGIGPARAQQPNFLTGFAEGPNGPAASVTPPQLKEVSFKQRLEERLPLDAPFRDETGRTVRLGDYFDGRKPVVLAFVYYQCPMLCMQVMNGISGSLKAVPFQVGTDFDVVLISFDPRDNPAAALEKKRQHLQHWSAEDSASAWHFLTGDEATIKRVTTAAGFNYKWDDLTQQFAHVSGILVLTPDGRLSRYFYGVEYSPKELRMALVESGQGHIGSAVDELLLFCYHYDPSSGRYGVMVMNLIRLGGALTVALLGGFMLMMWRRDARARVA